VTEQSAEFNFARVRRITLRLERLLEHEFQEEQTGEVITGFFLHAIICARDALQLPTENQQELIRTLNTLLDQDTRSPIPSPAKQSMLQRLSALLWRREMRKSVSREVDAIVDRAMNTPRKA